MEIFNYLLKVSACSAVFFAFYLLVLRKFTFFRINRFYLLLSLVISFTIPALQFTIEREVMAPFEATKAVALQKVDLKSSGLQEEESTAVSGWVGGEKVTATEAQAINWLSILPYGYGAIVAGLLGVALWRLFQLLKHTKAPVKEINGLKLVTKGTGFTNCSFFNYVFIDESNLTAEELSVLLAHEQVHANQYHSVDKLLLMVAKAILWFNPIIYLYNKALEQIHEYEADELTSHRVGTEVYATLLLNLAVSKSQNPLLHNFVKSPIKQRIKMLFNSKSKNMKKLAYLLALPIGLGLIWGFTIDVVTVSTPQENEFTLVIDAGHGGKQKGTVVNGVSEKEITLAMSKKLKAAAEAKGLKVVTTRSDDSNLSTQDRLKANGNFLISLHVNAQAKGGSLNGIEMFTSTSTEKLKMLRSVGMTYHLYQSLKDLNGLAINNKPKQQRLLILENSTMPAVILELGYLTNKNDFQFITNEKKQTELAEAIVEGVLSYKKNNKSDSEMKARIDEGTKISERYAAWKNSEKYRTLVAKAAKFKHTANGRIESFHYFSTRNIMDGFILNVNGERYRVYLNKELLKQYQFAIGDQVAIKANGAEVWHDSDYPVLKAKEILGVKKVAYSPVKLYPKPIVVYSSSAMINNKNEVTHIKNVTMKVFNGKLQAEEVQMDEHAVHITAKNAKFTTETGKVIESDLMTFDNNTGAFVANPPIPKNELSDAYKLLSKMSFLASDSIKVMKVMDDNLVLYGNVKMKIDDYTINGKVVTVNKFSNTITTHLGSVYIGDQLRLKADAIDFNYRTKEIKQGISGSQK